MIVKVPNKILLKKAKPVKNFDKNLFQVIKNLKKDLFDADKPKGVGLAAPQIGISLRVFITKPTRDSETRVFINPKIISKSEDLSLIEEKSKAEKEKSKKLEGCLSIPKVWGYLKRSKKVTLEYLNEKGIKKTEKFTGLFSTIVQHEVDHLDGILFTQKVLEQKEKLYNIESENGKDKLVELDV